MEERGPGIEPSPPIDARRRRIRAAAAGVVTCLVVVTGGLIFSADDEPASVVAVTAANVAPSPEPPRPPRPDRLEAPTHLSIDRGVTTVSLAWDPPARTDPSAIHHYEVFRDGKRVGRTTCPKFDVARLTFGTRYRFWVVAVDPDGRTSPRTLRSVTTKVPPLSSARLSGTYTVTASVSRADRGRVRFVSHAITWSLVPQCPDRACDVAFTATHRFGAGTVVTSGVLAWSGGTTYRATWAGAFGSSCKRTREAVSTLTVTMRATSAQVIGGLWVASAIGGAIDERVRGCGGAPSATYAF